MILKIKKKNLLQLFCTAEQSNSHSLSFSICHGKCTGETHPMELVQVLLFMNLQGFIKSMPLFKTTICIIGFTYNKSLADNCVKHGEKGLERVHVPKEILSQ